MLSLRNVSILTVHKYAKDGAQKVLTLAVHGKVTGLILENVDPPQTVQMY